MSETGDARGTLGTVRNAVRLLDLLTDGPAYQQLTDLADRSGLSVPTVHRLLRSLVLADLVEQDARSSRYSLGPEVTRLSHRYLARLPILGALSPYLVALRDTVGATIHVAVLVRGSVVYVDRVDGADGGPYRESHRVTDALTTAAGRVLVARADDEVWARAVAAHGRALFDAGADGEEACRKAWVDAPYLVTGSTALGAPGEIAVPVFDAGGLPVAALAASVSDPRDERLASDVAGHLARAAAAAGRTLGHG